MGHKILLIEDDRDIAHLVTLHLQDIGCDVEVAYEGQAGFDKAVSKVHDLIILDLMLPGIEGIEICRRLRSRTTYTPILMLTARSSELDRVLGLEMGADDYLTKPFSVRELIARVKAILRRVENLGAQVPSQSGKTMQLGDLMIDPDKRKVTLAGESVDLTAKEFQLLLQFAGNPGRVYTRSQLLDQVWGYGHEGYEHTVNSHINRLRAKIEKNPDRPCYILTVWGVGYKFSDADDLEKK